MSADSGFGRVAEHSHRSRLVGAGSQAANYAHHASVWSADRIAILPEFRWPRSNRNAYLVFGSLECLELGSCIWLAGRDDQVDLMLIDICLDANLNVRDPARGSGYGTASLRADLSWLLGILMAALNETPWGQIAPQVISAAATDQEARAVIDDFMTERIAGVEAVFAAAEARGEIMPNAPTRQIVEMAIAVAYFRKLIAGLPLNHEWLDSYVDMICSLAEKPGRRSACSQSVAPQ